MRRKPCNPSAKITFAMPATYPLNTINRKPILLPFAVLVLHDLAIEKGHAAPKHTSMIVSRNFCQFIKIISLAEKFIA